MPKNPQGFADLLEAKIAGQVPDVGGGPFGMARLGRLMHQRLTPGQGLAAARKKVKQSKTKRNQEQARTRRRRKKP
jgi:hypothetical protein